MNKMIFIKEQDKSNEHDTTKVTVETDAVTLTEVLDAFKDFLRASGFTIDGDLVVTDDE